MMVIDADVEDLPDNAPYLPYCRLLHHLAKFSTRTDHWQRTVNLTVNHLQLDQLSMNLREC